MIDAIRTNQRLRNIAAFMLAIPAALAVNAAAFIVGNALIALIELGLE